MLSNEEFQEMVMLKNAINYNPASVHPDRQERFTYLFVKSLHRLVSEPIDKPSTIS